MGLCSAHTMAGASMHREPALQYLRLKTQIRMKRQQGIPGPVFPATLYRHVALAGVTVVLLLSCSS